MSFGLQCIIAAISGFLFTVGYVLYVTRNNET